MNDNLMMIFDVKKFENNIKTTLSLFQLFIVIVGAIAFCISFFMLIISTTSNIKENMWELGVLRAIGLRKNQITRIYLYESLSVTIAAAILGLLVGFILAITLSLQFNIFLELPFSIKFPYLLVFMMLLLSLITTVFGTIIPIRDINSQAITSVLKAAG